MDDNYKVLYISDVDASMEGLLWEVFHQWKDSIASICVVASSDTQAQPGHAYVNFNDPTAAAEAHQSVQPLFLKTAYCHIHPFYGKNSPKNSISEHQERTGVFVKNLDSYARVQELYNLFKPFGNIVGCKIATDQYGSTRNFAYVRYTTREAADKAISEMNNCTVGKRNIATTYILRKSERGLKLFVRFDNMPDKWPSEKDLEEVFSQYSSFESVLCPSAVNSPGRSFAFVILGDAKEANRAISEISEVNGCQVFVSHATRTHEDKPAVEPTNLFIRNLTDGVTEEDLWDEFTKYGPVVSVKLMLDEAGRSRHFGFVRFSSANNAGAARQALDGAERWGHRLLVMPARQKKRIPSRHPEQPMYYPGPHMSSMPSYPPPNTYTGHAPQEGYYYPQEYMYSIPSTQELGEMLHPYVFYHEIVNKDATTASMVTGILLQKDPVQVMQWLYDPCALDQVIRKAHIAYMQIKRTQAATH